MRAVPAKVLGVVAIWRAAAAAALLATVLVAPPVADAGTLEDVRARGSLECGVSDGVTGFSLFENGRWAGLDVEFCSAIAAAVLGNKDAVRFRPLPVGDRFRALMSGEVDVLARNTTWTLSRDTELGVRFVDVLFYDGQGFLVPRTHALASALELSGAKICVMSATLAEPALARFFSVRRMRFQPVASPHWTELVANYVSGVCNVLTADLTTLAVERSRLANPAEHVLLPELVSKEPLAPAVRDNDMQWFAVVRWTLKALIAAEELGLTRANVVAMRGGHTSEELAGFFGASIGATMGLPPDWAFQIVKQVGNYGEIFERTVGQGSSLKLERRLNDLWSRGGLMYAPPMR